MITLIGIVIAIVISDFNTPEIGCILDASASAVARLRRERAQWPTAARPRRPRGWCGSYDARRRDTVFNPAYYGGKYVELTGCWAAPAVAHPRHHIKPREPGGLAVHFVVHFFIPVFDVVGGKRAIGQTLVDNEFFHRVFRNLSCRSNSAPRIQLLTVYRRPRIGKSSAHLHQS